MLETLNFVHGYIFASPMSWMTKYPKEGKFGTGEAGHFKFGIHIDRSKCQPVDDKSLTPEGSRSGFFDPLFKFWDRLYTFGTGKAKLVTSTFTN